MYKYINFPFCLIDVLPEPGSNWSVFGYASWQHKNMSGPDFDHSINEIFIEIIVQYV